MSGINISAKTDYSYLFSSLGTSSSSSSSSSLSWLSDYASIKNGSYHKLLKAYYAKQSSSADSTSSTDTKKTTAYADATTTALNKMETSSDALKDSADALLATGSKSLFAEKDITTTDANGVKTTSKGIDTDALYKAVNSFVNDYNSVITASADVTDSTVGNRVSYLKSITNSNSKALSEIGITIGEDNTLKLDKDTFQAADTSKVEEVFQGAGSYGYQVSAQSSMINYSTNSAINSTSLYTSSGSYSSLNTSSVLNYLL